MKWENVMPLFSDSKQHSLEQHFYSWAPSLCEIILLSNKNTYNCFIFKKEIVPVCTIMATIHNNNDNWRGGTILAAANLLYVWLLYEAQ
jgi:hypothetical protein